MNSRIVEWRMIKAYDKWEAKGQKSEGDENMGGGVVGIIGNWNIRKVE